MIRYAYALITLLALTLASCSNPADQPPDAAAHAGPTPSAMLAPGATATLSVDKLQAIANAANTQVAEIHGTATANVEATGEMLTRTQAAFDRGLTEQAAALAADAATSDARYTQDAATSNAQATAEAKVTAGFETSQALTAIASETFAYQTATATVAIGDTDFDRGIKRDRQWVTTWWPVIVGGLLLVVIAAFAVLAWLLIVRGFNLAELKLLAKDSYDTIMVNTSSKKASWLRRILDMIFGTGSKTIVKPGRMPGPVIEVEPEPRPDGHRSHAPQLAHPLLQERVNTRDQSVQLLHEWRQRQAAVQRRAPNLPPPVPHRQSNSSLPAPWSKGSASGIEEGDIVEGQFVEITTEQARRHPQLGLWEGEVRTDLDIQDRSMNDSSGRRPQ